MNHLQNPQIVLSKSLKQNHNTCSKSHTAFTHATNSSSTPTFLYSFICALRTKYSTNCGRGEPLQNSGREVGVKELFEYFGACVNAVSQIYILFFKQVPQNTSTERKKKVIHRCKFSFPLQKYFFLSGKQYHVLVVSSFCIG